MRECPSAGVLLALLSAAACAAEPAARFAFEKGVGGFIAAGGRGTIRWTKPDAPGQPGRLRLTLAEKAHQFRVASPAFAVRPWRIFRLVARHTVDRGVRLDVLVRLKCGATWREVRPTRVAGAGLFGVLPEATQAKVELLLSVPGRALGRSAAVESIAVTEHAPGGGGGRNLYWDGSFEQEPNAPPCGWSFWVVQPQEVGYATRKPRHGRRCYRVRGTRTIVVFGSVPVRPRRLYRLRYWVRGKGVVYPGLHKLAAGDRGTMHIHRAVRVGWGGPAVGEVRLRPDAWQAVEILTFCEDAAVTWFEPYFSLVGTVEVDDVELRAVERVAPAAGPQRKAAPPPAKAQPTAARRDKWPSERPYRPRRSVG